MRAASSIMTPKPEQYAALVTARKSCRLCVGLTNPADFEHGRYDSDEVGPWTFWQGNLDAKLMVVGQDWGDTQYFSRHAGREGPRNPTNVTLVKLLEGIGVSVCAPGSSANTKVAFFTNAVLCLKEGGLQAKVQGAWFQNCAMHLRRQVEIVQPRVVVGLGARAFSSIILFAFSLPPRIFKNAVTDVEGTMLSNGSRAFAVYHCGARILNTHRRLDAQRADWARIGRFLNA